MYQSLYRKYRPSNFNEVIGQDVPVKILKNAIKNNRIAHAYLFAGIRGTGKTSIAKIFARTINCLDPQDDCPCNKCVICTQNNTDIVEIDAASNNGVDEIRELREKISLVPAVSKYKVYIIDEVHMLSTSAFNALLKTLEEPPSHAIFILATTEAYKIPATILSRCQRLDFKAITQDEIISRLKYICKEEGIKIAPDAMTEIARLANGGMRDAISLLEQVWAYSEDITIEDVHKINGILPCEKTKDIFSVIINNDIQNCFSIIDEAEVIGVDFPKLIDALIYFAHNLILVKNNIKIEDNLYKKTDYDELKDSVTVDRLIELLRKFNAAATEIKTVSNKKIVFEMLIINSIGTEEPKKEVVREVTKKEEAAKAVVNPSYVEAIKKEFDALKKEEPVEEVEEVKVTKSEFESVKEIRVNNTLSEFDKRTLNSLQKKLEVVKDYAVDLEYNEIASILLDGKLKAASKEYMMYVYEEEIESEKFNKSILRIESLIKIITGSDYKVIAINNDEWEVIKEEFNSKKKKYEKKEEIEEISLIISKLSKTSEDFLDENFSDIISYE